MDELTADERKRLLRLARASIRNALGESDDPAILLDAEPPTPGMEQPAGAFVTIRTPPNKLRGCIGCMEWNLPLFRRIMELAPKAALHDPRFPPLTRDELPLARLEISVLTALQPLGDIRDLVLGRDGVDLRKDSAHSVFLPQVAPEQGWDADKLLRQLALKAGLPEDGWRGARLSVFRAEVFGEPRPESD